MSNGTLQADATRGDRRDGEQPVSGGSTRGMTRMDTGAEQTAGMHGNGMVMQADTVQGLAVSAGGLTLALGLRRATPGRRFQLRFRILDERTVRDFDVKHTKRLHLIVVRRDMIDFQHLHPTQSPTAAGRPRRRPPGRRHRYLAAPRADRRRRGRRLRDPAHRGNRAGGRGVPARVRRHAQRQARRAAELPRRQGTPGRPRQGDLAYLHVHPDTSLKFMATFPTSGSYRLFLQFKVDGRVHTAAFTQEVSV
jgi:hypothetical protein